VCQTEIGARPGVNLAENTGTGARLYAPLPQLTTEVATLAARVDEHFKKMGVAR
jgi:hypothetical protein